MIFDLESLPPTRSASTGSVTSRYCRFYRHTRSRTNKDVVLRQQEKRRFAHRARCDCPHRKSSPAWSQASKRLVIDCQYDEDADDTAFRHDAASRRRASPRRMQGISSAPCRGRMPAEMAKVISISRREGFRARPRTSFRPGYYAASARRYLYSHGAKPYVIIYTPPRITIALLSRVKTNRA